MRKTPRPATATRSPRQVPRGGQSARQQDVLPVRMYVQANNCVAVGTQPKTQLLAEQPHVRSMVVGGQPHLPITWHSTCNRNNKSHRRITRWIPAISMPNWHCSPFHARLTLLQEPGVNECNQVSQSHGMVGRAVAVWCRWTKNMRYREHGSRNGPRPKSERCASEVQPPSTRAPDVQSNF